MKIYLFCIGGTGSRVLKACTMLLASGVRIDADTIVPVIVETDCLDRDLDYARHLVYRYNKVSEQLHSFHDEKTSFFRTEIKEPVLLFDQFQSWNCNNSLEWNCNMSAMSRPNRALAQILYSQQQLRFPLERGLIGNPEIGSVVLNQFENCPEFCEMFNGYYPCDKIFIVSSAFGSTGASGFPLLLTALRFGSKINNANLVHAAQIGAIVVTPYFRRAFDDDFISRTKTTLAYYLPTINHFNEVDNFYYVGDDVQTLANLGNCKTDASFVELVSALAMVDFAHSDNPNPDRKENARSETKYKEYGIRNDTTYITFDDLGPKTKELLIGPMTQFLLFSKYVTENADYSSCYWVKSMGFTSTFFHDSFFDDLKDFLMEYKSWLTEMGNQNRAFVPFDLHCDPKRVFDIVNGIPARRTLFFGSNYDFFDNRLYKMHNECSGRSREEQFVRLFCMATKQLIREKYNIE